MGVDILFFYGKGGFISWGLGLIVVFFNVLFCGMLNSCICFIEQGEIIVQKYVYKFNVVYNLELLVAGIFVCIVLDWQEFCEGYLMEVILECLVQDSWEYYVVLFYIDGFIFFFWQVIFIDVIEFSKIGFCLVKWIGVSILVDLRAIFWVFVWGQFCYYMISWYGLGIVLQLLEKEKLEVYMVLKV